ncbi:M56 family metallopeptidase [Halomicronema hongdechloris]|nr:M56 family metallopeptidase [Halomicronema hongdechloris]
MRLLWPRPQGSWPQRWWSTLQGFSLPPLLLLTMALAVLGMGGHGHMLGLPVSHGGCGLALLWWGIALGHLVWAGGQMVRSHQQTKHLPVLALADDHPVSILPVAIPYAAQTGIWQPKTLLSQGLLQELNQEELSAVLAHEAAHCHYQDPFWFFWLGWLRRWSGWLPRSEDFWQDLLLLRELRADQWASQRVDPLLLASVLVKLAAMQQSLAIPGAISLHEASLNRLEERVDALLNAAATDSVDSPASVFPYPGWSMALLPLLTILLHQ